MTQNNDPTKIPKSRILTLIDTSLHDAGVSKKLKKVLIKRIEKGIETKEGDSIDQEFAYELIYSFRYLLKYGMENFGARPGRKFDLVDIETFVCSSLYMDQKDSVRPAIMEELKRLFKDPNRYHEVILGGSIGSGKNYFTDMALAYVIYDLSSYYSPQVEFGLAPGSSIYFMMQSASIQLAKSVIYNQFKARISLCSYFVNNFPYDKKTRTKLIFPSDIIVTPLSSTDTSALGLNIYGGIIDEMSFLSVVSASKKAGKAGREYNQAKELYNTVLRRMESRFMVLGKLPGKLFLVGSANYPGNFIDTKINETITATESGKEVPTFVMSMAQWESLPKDRFSGKKFSIELPNENTQGKILEKGEKPSSSDSEIKEVPVEYKDKFEKDFEGSLRDIAGIAIGTVSKFIRNVDKISLCAKKHKEIFEGKQLFISDKIMQKEVSSPEDIINFDFLEHVIDRNVEIGGHLDLAKSEDSLGLALGEVFGHTKTVYPGPSGEDYEEVLPVFCIDGAFSLVPPPNGEIDLFMIRDLILYLKDYLNIRFVNMDSWESAMMMQSFRRHRISSTIQSVDKSPQPYKDLKTAILTERLIFPDSKIIVSEIKNLIRTPDTGKIDHLPEYCFTEETSVITENGNKTMKELAENYKNGIFVLSYNIEEKRFEYNKAANPRITKYVDEIIEIEFEDGSIVRCTPNHPFLTEDDRYIKAEDLTEDIELKIYK